MSPVAGQPEWTGLYYDGRTAERRHVTVTLAPVRGPVGPLGAVASLRIGFADGSAIHWSLDAIRQTQGRHQDEQLRIEHGTDPVEALLVEQPGLAEAILRVAPNASRTVRERRRTATILAWSFGAIASAIALYVWGAPLAADWLTPRVPAAWEVEMGRSAISRLAPRERVCGDSADLAVLRSILDRLLVPMPKAEYEYTLVVVRDTTVNAFAAPGGFLSVHSGLIAATRTPEEFAGVLAHEIQHVRLRHSTRAIIREAPLRYALTAISGGGGMETVMSLAVGLQALSYRRADEAEADREGMRLLEAARVDANGMVSFMRSLDKDGEAPPRLVRYLSSHPHSAQRAGDLARQAEANTYVATTLTDSITWSRIRGLCH